MEQYFLKFRAGIAGVNATIPTTDGNHMQLVYADWAASGRNYLPIETRIQEEIMPLMTNTEAEVNHTRIAMTYAYYSARKAIKEHINASSDDILLTASSGATMLIKRFQAMLGLRTNTKQRFPNSEKPVVFVTHMEHHSNHASWAKTDAIVEVVNSDETGLVSLEHLQKLLFKYKDSSFKIASVTACSNLTGIIPPFDAIAKIMHANGGFLFVDFSCSAPYVVMNMNPHEEDAHLDAIFFSAHKFLGGPGSTGVLAFNQKLYNKAHYACKKLSQSRDYKNDRTIKEEIERREFDGTPSLLQTIKAAMCIRLKEEMGIQNILSRERNLLNILWKELELVPKLHILASQHRKRLAIVSFYIENLDSCLGARLLNDKFAIQCKASYTVPGSYGDSLIEEESKEIQGKKTSRRKQNKRGFIRISLHPVLMDDEVRFLAQSIAQLAIRHHEWSQNYSADALQNFSSKDNSRIEYELKEKITSIFTHGFV